MYPVDGDAPPPPPSQFSCTLTNWRLCRDRCYPA